MLREDSGGREPMLYPRMTAALASLPSMVIVSGTLWRRIALLRKRRAASRSRSILCCKRGGRTQTEPEVPQGIDQERQQHVNELLKMAMPAWACRHEA
jgi:hypothetical protein